MVNWFSALVMFQMCWCYLIKMIKL
jgi:hypothetical protein